MKTHLTQLGAILVLAACAPKPSTSKPLEAADVFNSVSKFEIYGATSYNELLDYQTVVTPNLPWSDTYWPIANKGLAWRYAPHANASLDRSQEVRMASFIEHFSAEMAKDQPDPTLSPGEKYDILFQARHGISLNQDQLKSLVTDLKDRDASIKAQSDMSAKKSALIDIVRKIRSNDTVVKGSDGMSMTLGGWDAFLLDSAGDKNQYLGDPANVGADWSWEGHCHGWSPAAVMTRRPKHGVMAVMGAKKVFMSEGDLRGLMTKAWADQAPDSKQYFLGRRCEKELADTSAPIDANAIGRGYTGSISTRSGNKMPFVIVETLPTIKDMSITGGDGTQVFAYIIRVEGSAANQILVEDSYDGKFWLLPNIGAFNDVMLARSLDVHNSVKAEMSGCWDTNPASFHQVLVQQLGIRKEGFVMDRTRTGQVWNQPIYEADFKIGLLRDIHAVKDIAAPYRSQATAFVAEVTATVFWSGEPEAPSLAYDANFDRGQLQNIVFKYTLEFDADKQLIGGEWGTLSSMSATALAPDFIYGFQKGSTPEDSLAAFVDDRGTFHAAIDYTGIIGKLHDCSQVDATTGSINVAGIDYPYSECVIEKSTP